ncbi:MAG: NAD(+) synthase [Nitrospirae bacterium GWC2_42_7]|nr:MAG: NAD(+) synthase [Nitrospirae bacterium GWC2_42_7]
MSYTFVRKDAKKVIQKTRGLIQKYFKENGLKYAIFGKSEGLDSSVIAGLLSDLDGVKPIGVVMPCESDIETESIARIVLEHFSIPYLRVDLTREYHYLAGHFYSSEGVHGQLSNILKEYNDIKLMKALPHKKNRAKGNIKARLRMITLYHIAQLTGGLVVSTDNLSELWMGFWTLNGDVGDLSPIQYVWKGLEEYEIARALGVPEESIKAVPTDGLDVIPGGTDEDQLGLPYKDLDRVIVALLQNKFDGSGKWEDKEIDILSKRLSTKLKYDPERILHVARQMQRTVYKRNWPKNFRRDEIGLSAVDGMKI